MRYARNGTAAETTPFTVAPCAAGTEQALVVRSRSSVKLEAPGVLLESSGQHGVGAGRRLDHVHAGEVAGKRLAHRVALPVVDFDGGLRSAAVRQHAHAEGFAGGGGVAGHAAGQRARESYPGTGAPQLSVPALQGRLRRNRESE